MGFIGVKPLCGVKQGGYPLGALLLLFQHPDPAARERGRRERLGDTPNALYGQET